MTHYCTGDALLQMQVGTFPTDDQDRPLPGYKPYLLPRAQAEARMEADALAAMAAEMTQDNNTDD